MSAIVPEAHKKAGVSYAFTDDGIELPVIDVTHPAFTIAPTDAASGPSERGGPGSDGPPETHRDQAQEAGAKGRQGVHAAASD